MTQMGKMPTAETYLGFRGRLRQDPDCRNPAGQAAVDHRPKSQKYGQITRLDARGRPDRTAGGRPRPRQAGQISSFSTAMFVSRC